MPLDLFFHTDKVIFMMFIEEKLIKYCLLKAGAVNYSIYQKMINNHELKRTLLYLFQNFKEKTFSILDNESQILSYLQKTPDSNEELKDYIINSFLENIRGYLSNNDFSK